MVNPSRIEFARTRRRWTKAKLANELGIQARSIQGYESGEYAPEADKLELMGKLLGFPVDFFYGEDLPVISEHTASFRSMSKMTVALKNSALNAGAVAFMLNGWIEKRFTLPKAELPDLSDLAPEEAASTLRRMWGLGAGPVGNMIHLLESKGVRVYSLAIEAREVDAFSVWHENCPFVFLNTLKSAEHSRFDAAHELAHLVRDTHSMLHGKAHSPEMEREANAFASAFLMPRESVVAYKPDFVTLNGLIGLKKIWGVSLAALAYRMNSLRLLTEWTYRSLCIDIAKKGYRTAEPEPMRHEVSLMLAKVFDLLREEGIQKSDIARDLLLKIEDLDNLTFCLTLSGVTSSKISTNSLPSANAKPKLRLI